MKATLEPVGKEVDWFKGSAVTELTNTNSGLRIVVAASVGVDRYLEIHFPYARAFQAMDEGDMLEYWTPPLPGGYVLYKITGGGWRERVDGHFLHVTSALDNMLEWLIVTDDLCVTVLSAHVPHVREFG